MKTFALSALLLGSSAYASRSCKTSEDHPLFPRQEMEHGVTWCSKKGYWLQCQDGKKGRMGKDARCDVTDGYAFGTSDHDSCPAGSSVISSVEECKIAALDMGWRWLRNDGHSGVCTLITNEGPYPSERLNIYYGKIGSSAVRESAHHMLVCRGVLGPTCPTERPEQRSKCSGELTCEYGKVECCGEEYPDITYTCVGDRWLSFYTDIFCDDTCPGTAPTCPTERPDPMGTCSGQLRCEYGKVECCGEEYPDITYTCGGGRWRAVYTDIFCDDTCPGSDIWDGPVYEEWDCAKCNRTPGYQYCSWDGQFNADGGCLPTKDDFYHVACGNEEGDVLVTVCDGKARPAGKLMLTPSPSRMPTIMPTPAPEMPGRRRLMRFDA